jgi:hypothetical protein
MWITYYWYVRSGICSLLGGVFEIWMYGDIMKVALAIACTALMASIWLNVALWTREIVRPLWVSDDITAMQLATGKKP